MAGLNPHDHYIRRFFSQTEHALELFRHWLPGEVFALFKPESLRLSDASFIDKNQKESRADLLFEVDLKSEASIAQVYCLFEHKSYRDDKIYVQLLKYLARIYERQLKEHSQIFPVIPLVFYHGKQEWTLGSKFSDQFHKVKPYEMKLLHPYLPDFQIELVNLPKEDLLSHKLASMVKMMLGIVKHLESSEFNERIIEYLRLHSGIPDRQKVIDFLQETLYYLFSVKEILPDSIIELLERARFEQSEYEAIVMTTAEKLREEGKLQGLAEGRQEGRQEGVVEGKLDAALKMKKEGLSLEQILRITGLSTDDLRKAGIAE